MTNPNIIFISLDSLRADHLPFYGYSRDTAPVLSKLVNEEKTTLFENAFTTTAWTLPAHASIFTGLYPSEHGVFDGDLKIDPEITLPAKLSAEGYKTLAFLNNGWLTKSGVTDGFDERVNVFEMGTPSSVVTRNLNRLKMLFSFTDSGAKQTIANFERRHSTLSRPFFGFFHLMEPHYLYNPVRPYNRSYNSGSTMRLLLKQRSIYTQRGKYYDGQVAVDDANIERFIDLYDGEIKYVDEQLKELFLLLKRAEEFKNTMIVVFGDHGELFGENNLIGHHFSLSDALLHVPLLVKWPNQYRPVTESRVSTYVELSDLYGTILRTVGVENDIIEGRSLESKYEAKCRTAYAEYKTPESLIESFEAQTNDGTFPSRLKTEIEAFRHDNHKLVVTNKETKLYDVVSDPGETKDLSGNKPDDVSDLQQRMNNHINDVQSRASQSTTEFSEDVEEQLRKLGYIQHGDG